MGYELDILESPAHKRKKANGDFRMFLCRLGLLPNPVPAAVAYPADG